ncbi:hypothetical protein [Bradyrhizobium sp. USDA 3458]|uniref:hypothetical protein n=1 Tax=Bradyrhizobium sp. USDA 3458 TaxID=2591461 RepID=UPI001144E087|nr:hypothetical protein [Bradyrhizobium sp. USDA 3458]
MLLFHCRHCGLVFSPSGFLALGPIVAHGNVAQCPRCRHVAEGIDGTFDFVGNAIRVLDAPPRTIELLSALQDALRKAEQAKPVAEVISRVEETSPELARAIQGKVSSRGPLILAGLLCSLLASCSVNATLDLNTLIDQVHTYWTGAEPYPDSARSGSEQPPGLNRQQRRHQERHAKKQQRQTELRRPKKPKQ